MWESYYSLKPLESRFVGGTRKISFGEMLVGTNENKKNGLINKAKAKMIDIAIENDYKKNL